MAWVTDEDSEGREESAVEAGPGVSGAPFVMFLWRDASWPKLQAPTGPSLSWPVTRQPEPCRQATVLMEGWGWS